MGGVGEYSVFNKLSSGNSMDPIASKIIHCLFVPLHCNVLEKYVWIVDILMRKIYVIYLETEE